MANKWIGTGNLTREVESMFTPSGVCVAKFAIACNERWTDRETGERKESVEYVNIVAFGKLGEICSKYLIKGKKIYAEGKLKTSSWETDGVKRYKTEVELKEMEMLGGRSEAGNQGQEVREPEDPNIPF